MSMKYFSIVRGTGILDGWNGPNDVSVKYSVLSVIRGTGVFEGWNGTKVVSTNRVLDRVRR